MENLIPYLNLGVSAIGLGALVTIAYRAGKIVERVNEIKDNDLPHLQKQIDGLREDLRGAYKTSDRS